MLSSKTEENLFLNIGTGVETSVNNLVTTIKNLFESDISPIYENARDGELLRSVLDNSKAQQELGWKPNFDLEKGLLEVINWLKAK